MMVQTWHDLLFMHWPVDAGALRPDIPDELELDLFDGQAWIGVIPFRMTGIRFRWLPPLPFASAFCELNVRTYVKGKGGDGCGIWFFSLDATNPIAIAVAKAWFHLPYSRARMQLEHDNGWIRYDSDRRDAHFHGRYRPTGDVYRSKDGDLDHWLTERYSLFSRGNGGRVYRGDIEHDPWPLQPAEAEIEANTMAPMKLPDQEPLLHFARRVDATVHAPYRL